MPARRRLIGIVLAATAICGANAPGAAQLLSTIAAPAATHQPVDLVGELFEHTVARGESWQTLAARYGIESGVLARLNGRAVDKPLRAGESVQIDGRHLVPPSIASGIVINVPQRMLFLKTDGKVVASYPAGLGRASWPTFVGRFSVVAAEIDPVWDVPPSIQEEMQRAGKRVLTRVPPGPANPLGKYWLGLSDPNFGIHGTNAPQSIYRFQTHGCIRLHPDDIADLWPRAPTGTPGETVYEPVLIAVDAGRVLLEVHGDAYKRSRPAQDIVEERVQVLEIEDRIDWDVVKSVVAAREGTPRDVTASRPTTRLHPPRRPPSAPRTAAPRPTR